MSSDLLSLVKNLEGGNREQIQQVYSRLSSIADISGNSDLSKLIPLMKRDIIDKDSAIADAAFKGFSALCKGCEFFETSTKGIIRPLIDEALRTTATTAIVKDYFSSIASCIPCTMFVQVVHDSLFKNGKQNITEEVKKSFIEFVGNLIMNKENGKTDIEGCYVKIIQIFLILSADDCDVIRKRAVEASHLLITACPVQSTHIAPIASCLKVTIMPKIKSVYSRSATLLSEVLQHQWPLFLKIMGISIRKSSSLINALLSIVEQGFRHPQADVKTSSFKAWDCLVICLAEDISVLSSARYMKLLMQPLTSVQSSDDLNITRIETLWCLANKLGPKLPMLFTTVCLPILHFCLGSLNPESLSKKSLDNATASSIKARRSSCQANGFYSSLQANGYKATPRKASQSSRLQNIGVEVLVHLLASVELNENSEITEKLQMPKLDCVFLSTAATFSSQAPLLISAVSEVLCYMVGLSEDMARLLWTRLHYHVKLHLETNLRKKKRETEVFNLFLMTLQNAVNVESLSDKLTSEMLQSFLELPGEILSSTFFGGSLNTMHGIPVLCLLKLIFNARLIRTANPDNIAPIAKCVDNLIMHGFQHNIGILSFCQSVVEIFQGFAHLLQTTRFEEMPDMKTNLTLLATVWDYLGKRLDTSILKSQEVNQGDSLDHDFSALYMFLLFPISIGMPNNNCAETWCRVYKSFVWCSGFVTTCKPNEICDYLSSALLKEFNDGWPESAIFDCVEICKFMIMNAEYNHNTFNRPGKSSLLGTQGIESDVSVIHLKAHKNLAKVCVIISLSFKYLEDKPNDDIFSSSLKCLSHLFTSIHDLGDVRAMFIYFLPSLNSAVSAVLGDKKLFREHFQSVLNAVTKAYTEHNEAQSLLTNGCFTNFFTKCMCQKDQAIRNVLVEFWQKVFIDSSDHSSLCDALTSEFKSCIFPVYKQMGWHCPWKDLELPNSVNLPDASNTQSQSLASTVLPVTGYGAFGSPLKKRGLVLSPHKSPSGSVSSPAKPLSKVKKKLCDLVENVSYIKCISPFQKPRTLTERQKEKLNEKGFIPVLYNDLDERDETDEKMDSEDENSQAGALEKDNLSFSGNDAESASPESIIKSSQSQDMCKKKMRMEQSTKKKRISLKAMTLLPKQVDEDSDHTDGVRLRRSGRIQKMHENEISNGIAGESNFCEEPNISTETESENDSLIGKENVKAVQQMDDTTSSGNDASYEYVEIADASTDQTRHETSALDDSDDGKDLGVTPLDDSYEYVEVADMSLNVTANLQHNISSVDNEEAGDDLINDTGNASEYKAVAVAEKSAFATVRLKRINAVVDDEKRIRSLSGPTKEYSGKPLVRRSLRNKKHQHPDVATEESDQEESTSPVEEGNVTLSKNINEAMNTTEYEYVEVADMSIMADKHESIIGHESDFIPTEDDENVSVEKEGENKSHSEPDVSNYEESLFDHSGLISEEDEEYCDARSSLGENSLNLHGRDSGVISASGKTSVLEDVSDTSIEIEERTIQESVVLIKSSSDSDEAEVDHKSEIENILPGRQQACNEKRPSDVPSDSDQNTTDADEAKDPSSEDPLTKALTSESSHAHSKATVFKKPAVTISKDQTMLPPGESPSAKGILKRRMTIGTDVLHEQSPGNRRRVSFAEPISKSRRMEVLPGDDFQQSPRSSLMHRKKHSPRVNRRLSLQPDKKSNDVQVSPLSLRSVKVAEAIANIRAKDCGSPSRLLKADAKRTTDKLDFDTILVKELKNPAFVESLSKSQLNDLFTFLLNAMPALHDALMKAVDT